MPSSASVTVGAKRTIEYVVDCAARLNAASEIEVRAVGQCIAKAADVVQVLQRHLGVQVGDTSFSSLARDGIHFSTSSTHLRLDRKKLPENGQIELSPDGFVRFPVYSLLMHELLLQTGELRLSLGADNQPFLKLKPSETGFQCTPTQELLKVTRGKEDVKVTRGKEGDGKKVEGQLVTAFTRAGLIHSPRWCDVCTRIGTSDDVILGLDTNVLYDCMVTQQLLDGFVLTSAVEHVHGPNWLLLVVPATVMHEIEQAANNRKSGQLTRIGRMGYRALQEILELDQSKDLRGVSLLIVGESNPVLDARVELQGLRQDLKETADPNVRGRLYHKHSAGDTIIRDQFKAFLRQLSFHKGAYFMTSDKSNSALGQAEGLHSVYFPPPPWHTFPQRTPKVEAPVVEFGGDKVHLTCPIGKLLYELAVEFEAVTVEWNVGSGNRLARFECDLKGDSLEHWVQRDLRLERGLKGLVQGYSQGSRKIPLGVVEEIWNRMSKDSMDWL